MSTRIAIRHGGVFEVTDPLVERTKRRLMRGPQIEADSVREKSQIDVMSDVGNGGADSCGQT